MTVVVAVHLKQPTVLEKAKEDAQRVVLAVVQKAKHCICGGGQVEQKHVALAEQALTSTESRVTKMEGNEVALSQENFDIHAFPEQVPNIAAKLGMSEDESKLVALAPHVEVQASHEMKTYYDNKGNLVKHLTSWRTIRSNSAHGKPDKIYFVYGDFALKCKVPEEGLEFQSTVKLEHCVNLRAKLEWAQQLEETGSIWVLLGLTGQLP